MYQVYIPSKLIKIKLIPHLVWPPDVKLLIIQVASLVISCVDLLLSFRTCTISVVPCHVTADAVMNFVL